MLRGSVQQGFIDHRSEDSATSDKTLFVLSPTHLSRESSTSPVNVEGKSRPLQFTLQSVMLAMVLLGFAIANWRLVLAFASGFFWATTLAIAYAFFFIGRSTRSLLVPPSSGIFRRSLARAMLFVSLCTSATILWARHRWFGWFYDSYWPPKTFPYPDAMLAAFHNWIDATFPAPDGYLKIHGEFYSVLICLNGAAWLACACFGFYFGLLYRSVVPIGFRRRRDRMVKFTQTATEPSDIANGFAIDDSHTVIPWRGGLEFENLSRVPGGA